MTTIRWVWLVLAVLYAAFFSWYTSFGGSLTEQEIGHYMGLLEQRKPTPTPEALARLRRFM